MTIQNKQKRFHRERAVRREGGIEYIPLSPVVGGHLDVKPVMADGMKYYIRPTAPAPRGWYKDKHTPPNVRPRPCYTEALLTTPYSGYCFVNCQFCYVNFGTRGYKSTLLPTVNLGYPERMDRQLSKMGVTGAAYISSYTEPFQEWMEQRHHVTERLARVFVKHNVPIFFLTRRPCPPWVKEILLSNPYSYMQWSVNSSNPRTLKRISPGMQPLDTLLETVEDFSRAGIYTSFQVNPVLPGIVDLDDILRLIEMLARAGGHHVIIKFAEISPAERKLFLARLAGVEGADKFAAVFNQHLGHQVYVDQQLRVRWLNETLAHTRRLGITMSTCYEYYDNGQAGANLAPWYTTSDQCHGPAVPIHYRPAPGEPFRPLPGCYRKGCLYCEEHGTRACRNPTLLQAKALKYKDYRSIWIEGRDEDWSIPDSCPLPERARERGRNPELKTDAELWGLPPLEEVLANGRRPGAK